MADNRALSRSYRALRLWNIVPFDNEEPFAAIIRCTADPSKVDKRTRSKWSRVLRYALEYKPDYQPVEQFVRERGGTNKCASRWADRAKQ